MKCPKCGTEFQGNFCPKCCTPAKKDNNSKNSKVKKGCLTVFAIPFVLFALLLIIGLFLPDTPEAEPVNNSTASTESVSTTNSITTNPTNALTEDVTEPSQELSERDTSSTENQTEKFTEKQTQKPTEKQTQKTTEKSTQKQAQTSTKKPSNNTGYVVNVNTNKVHRSSCRHVNENCVSVNANEIKNYEACKTCKPY